MKKETLEEAAKNYAEKVGNVTGKGWLYDAVKFGANYQAERMYSEEDLREVFKQSRQCKIFEKDMPPVYETFEEWFEQFKKK